MYYKVIERKNPQRRDEAPKHYGTVASMGSVSIEDIAGRISASCTVTRHDCLAVLSALQEQIIYCLQEGKSVRLGDLGSFRVIMNSLGSDKEEDFNTSYIKRLKVHFTPNTTLRSAISLKNAGISLLRLETDTTETPEAGEETV